MKIEQASTIDNIHAIVTGDWKFKVAPGFDPVSPGNQRSMYLVNDGGDTIDIIIVDAVTTPVLNELLKELSVELPVEQYQMVVQRDFARIAVQRARSPPSWGIKSRYRVTYNARSSKEDTRKSLLAKINRLRYQQGIDRDVFTGFFDNREVVDKFYTEYEKIRKELASSIDVPSTMNVTIDDRDEYATTLMNRVVFTFFLQAPNPLTGQTIIPERFLQDLYQKHGATGNSYYRCLCRLWFDYFNSDAPRTTTDGMFKDIPYLNGGLFSYKEGFELSGNTLLYNQVDVPDATWERIVTLLDGYTWTVMENDEEDDELAITPSILGHIYEKACNQKESGSYYTPDHVTNYITKECIGKIATDRVNDRFKASIANFLDVVAKDEMKKDEIEQVKWFQEQVLDTITICDNACGSGAFLLAAEKILVDLHVKCNQWTGRKVDRHAIKKCIVTRNLYGVDIQEGSTEIAKLRLWLSMISSMQGGHVEPLPNIDYNILAGNSLVGFVKMPGNWGKSLYSNPAMLKKKLDEYRTLKEEYRDATRSIDAIDCKQKIDGIRKSVREEMDAIFKEDLVITESQVADLKLFHWAFEFEEVFSRGGFDIVIGNPPYVRQETVKHFISGFDYKGLLFKLYNPLVVDAADKTIKLGGTVDLSMYFILRSHQHVKKGGLFSYIITTKWLRSAYGKPVRHFLKCKTALESIRDFTGIEVFRGIGVDTLIYIAKKDMPKPDHVISYNEPPSIDAMDEGAYPSQQSELDDDSWMFLRPETREIKDWIERKGKKIEEMPLNTFMGIKTGLNEAFIIDDDKKRELIGIDEKNKDIIKPILRGKDIFQYKIEWNNLWFLYVPWHFPIDPLTTSGVSKEAEQEFKQEYPDIYSHLENYKEQLSNRNKDETGVRYEWYALQRFGSTYYKDFNLPKIVNRDMSNIPNFCFDNRGFYGNTAMYMTTPKKSMEGNMILLTLLLNSTTVFFYFKQFASKLGNKGYRFWKDNLIRISIIMPKNHPSLFKHLSEIIHYAAARDSPHLDCLKDIANVFVQDLYFHEKFHADGIYPENKEWLAELVEPCIEQITFEEWDALDWKREKGEITPKETKELESIIKDNDAVIEKVVKAIQGDTEIHRVIGLIKQHPWVKIIEKETKNESVNAEDDAMEDEGDES